MSELLTRILLHDCPEGATPCSHRLKLFEQALLAERRLARLEDAEIADKMAAACQQRAESLESFSPGHEAWGAAQLDILANALRAAAEKEVEND